KAPWGEMHVLGYFLSPADERLQAFLTETRAARLRRAEQMVSRLRQLGVDIAVADVVAAADGGAVGRPHVARVLVERGASADMSDAFTRYLGRGRPGYVEKPLPSLAQVSGGSDWHGDTELGDEHASLGGLEVPLEWLENLERRRVETVNGKA